MFSEKGVGVKMSTGSLSFYKDGHMKLQAKTFIISKIGRNTMAICVRIVVFPMVISVGRRSLQNFNEGCSLRRRKKKGKKEEEEVGPDGGGSIWYQTYMGAA